MFPCRLRPRHPAIEAGEAILHDLRTTGHPAHTRAAVGASGATAAAGDCYAEVAERGAGASVPAVYDSAAASGYYW